MKKIINYLIIVIRNRKISSKRNGFYMQALKYIERSYYLDDEMIYTINSIAEELDINKNIISEIIVMLNDKEAIKVIGKGQKKFKLKYNAAIIIRDIINSNKSNFNNDASVPISLSALLLSIGIASNNYWYHLYSILLLLYIFYLIYKFGKNNI